MAGDRRGRRGAGLARVAAVLVLPPLVSACSGIQLAKSVVQELAGTEGRPAGVYKVGKPYQIKGIWYYPEEDFDYVETGIASWYGPKFHGRRTANGEIFDMNKISAAHKTLQMPSLARVVNLENGRSLLVRINDRGPFVRGRIIDLSRRAAELLGVRRKGIARVRIEIVADESRRLKQIALRRGGGPGPASPRAGRAPARSRQLFVAAGTYDDFADAFLIRNQLAKYGAAQLARRTDGGSRSFQPRIGPVSSREDADALLKRLVAAGYTRARIVSE